MQRLQRATLCCLGEHLGERQALAPLQGCLELLSCARSQLPGAKGLANAAGAQQQQDSLALFSKTYNEAANPSLPAGFVQQLCRNLRSPKAASHDLNTAALHPFGPRPAPQTLHRPKKAVRRPKPTKKSRAAEALAAANAQANALPDELSSGTEAALDASEVQHPTVSTTARKLPQTVAEAAEKKRELKSWVNHKVLRPSTQDWSMRTVDDESLDVDVLPVIEHEPDASAQQPPQRPQLREPSQDVIEFLEAQLDGQGRPWAREAMRQLPHEPPGFATVTEMPELRQVTDVVSVLQSRYGFEPQALQPMLHYCPWILTQPVDRLAEGHEFLEELVGLTPAQIRKAVHAAPRMLCQQMDSAAAAHLDYLASLGITQAGFVTMISRYPKLLWLNLEQRTRTTVGCLVGFGINNGGLRRVLTHAPRVLAQTLPQINTRFTFVQRVLGGSVQDVVREPSVLLAPVQHKMGPRWFLCQRHKRSILMPTAEGYKESSSAAALYRPPRWHEVAEHAQASAAGQTAAKQLPPEAPVPLCALTRHGSKMLNEVLGLNQGQLRKGIAAWHKDPQSRSWQRLEDGLEDEIRWTESPMVS